jgi:hypothetical protein
MQSAQRDEEEADDQSCPPTMQSAQRDEEEADDQSQPGSVVVIVVVIADGRRLCLLTDALASFGDDIGYFQPG